MTSTDFSVLDDPPSDAPTRRAAEERRTQSQTQPGAEGQTAAQEQQFISRLLKRDAQSWNEFISRYERLIVSRILSTCRECSLSPSADLIEECAAEVLAALFHGDLQGLRQFQGRSKLSTWLAVVIRRTTLTVLRRQHRDQKQVCPNDSQFDIATVADPLPDPPQATRAEERAQLAAGMARLKESDRRVLEMYFEQKKSYAEIGRALGISENAVGPKIHRARKRLKQLMKANRKPS